MVAHGNRLTGQFPQHAVEKAAALKYISSELFSKIVFNQGLNGLKGVDIGLDTLKYNFSPNAQGLIINRIFFYPNMKIGNASDFCTTSSILEFFYAKTS